MFNWLFRLGAWIDRTVHGIWTRLSHFFWPGRRSSVWRRVLPYVSILGALALMFILGGATWEVTNSNAFCGLVCHTMPPEYISYLNSPHSRVKCVECHIGRTTIATQFTRKAHDISHVIKYLGTGYETPIYVKGLRPAQEICERCHSPEKFSANSQEVIKRYDAAKNNELTETYLSFKTGGGTQREGLGKGIHWHIENDIEYIYTDDKNLQQEIPWVKVTYADTGETEIFTDIEADLPADFVEQNQDNVRKMDCVTCHNRNSHEFKTPDEALDDAMARAVISSEIPYFKQNAVAIMERSYPSMGHAASAIEGLKNYYESNWPDYYAANPETVDQAVAELQRLYKEMVYPTMDVSWTTHPDNAQHKDSPGCFRCHDGKHVNEQNESIRVECNLCHTIPLKAPADGSTAVMPLTEPFEPESHVDSNWISRHRFEFDAHVRRLPRRLEPRRQRRHQLLLQQRLSRHRMEIRRPGRVRHHRADQHAGRRPAALPRGEPHLGRSRRADLWRPAVWPATAARPACISTAMRGRWRAATWDRPSSPATPRPACW